MAAQLAARELLQSDPGALAALEDFPSLGAPNDVWLQLDNHIQQLGSDPGRTTQLVPRPPPAGRAATDSLVAAQLAARELLQSDPDALAALASWYPDGHRGGAVEEYTTALHHKFKASAASYREGVEAYIRRLKEAGVSTYVVTNSSAEDIIRLLQEWEDPVPGNWLAARVRGNARKFAVAEGSEGLYIPGFRRLCTPTYLTMSRS